MIIMASIGQRVRFVKLHSIAWYRLALYSIAWYPTWFLLQVHKIYKNQLFSIIDGIPIMMLMMMMKRRRRRRWRVTRIVCSWEYKGWALNFDANDCNPEKHWWPWLWWWLLASQDALEVINASQSVTLGTELTDVTLVSEDTYWRLYWCNFGDLWYLWRWCWKW